ncbi:MAG TPA: hypothetical protein VFZ23_04505 [Pyrinomonadaceae bacterium]
MQTASSKDELVNRFASRVEELYERGASNAPNFGVAPDAFKASINNALLKFLSASPETATDDEVTEFLEQLQVDDLFMALGCANGNERAWWEFHQQHRSYLERVARHLAKTDIDAQEVIDCVYVELYGTRVVDGARVSKFATYSGRGSLRGWLRTVIWHSLVDQHRASHDEVSLDEMTETIGEASAHANFAARPVSGESKMVEDIARDRYRQATVSSIDLAFSMLDDHERLLLLYYHVEQLKLREIARLVENETSVLRGWFQRKVQSREKNPGGRIHESTIMRWLDKCYSKVLQHFKTELKSTHGLSAEEIQICLDLATQDLTANGLFRNLGTHGGISGDLRQLTSPTKDN